jgi:hypothetical protein
MANKGRTGAPRGAAAWGSDGLTPWATRRAQRAENLVVFGDKGHVIMGSYARFKLGIVARRPACGAGVDTHSRACANAEAAMRHRRSIAR